MKAPPRLPTSASCHVPVIATGLVTAYRVHGRLMDTLYRRHPIGSLLLWATVSEDAQHRGEGGVAPGVVKLLLDGQQRMTTLYGINNRLEGDYWWLRVDLNHRPQHYECRALTN